MRAAAALALVGMMATIAQADVDPKRKVVVLEYRNGSSALRGIANDVVATLGKQTSLQLLGPDQTRTVYGEHLDQVLAKCAGEAECVARIGQKVGAAEVILVGVSELGDVILTMQRIDVPGRSVSARIADSLANGAPPTGPQLDGYLTRLLPPTDFLRFGVIDIIATETGANVTIGGKPAGLTPIQPLRLHAPSTYDIRVEKRGFVPYTASVQLPPDAQIKVDARLSRRIGAAWYQHWYVLAGLGLVVAAAAGTTIYFATRDTGTMGMPSDHDPITGTIH
jgi:hypothetical protein